MIYSYKVGDKIKFKSEKQRYTIMACDKRFIIAQKPFNARKTYLYVIVDLKRKIRGADNYYCRYNYSKTTQAEEALKELNETFKKRKELRDAGCLSDSGFDISSRNRIKLDMERIDRSTKSINVFTDSDDIYGKWSSITDNKREVFEVAL